MKRLTVLLLGMMLAGCGSGQPDDLVQFVKNSGQDLRGKVEPLPEIKPYEAFGYDAFDLPDPFKPRKLASKGGLQPDMNRPKEQLEAYSLETLRMAGILQKNKVVYALVRTSDNMIYRVKTGNYMGQNFGRITNIALGNNGWEIKLKEMVQDSSGDWVERESSIYMQEEGEQK